MDGARRVDLWPTMPRLRATHGRGAQALLEPLRLLTADPKLTGYGELIVLA